LDATGCAASTSHTLEIKLALNRNYDPAPTSAYIKELKRMAEVARPFGVLAIDVGANIGFFTLLQAGVLGSQAKVIAIEPESDNIERLKANINLNHYSNIEVIQASIGAEKGVGILRTRSHLGQERHKMSEIMPQGEAAGSQPVTVLTIDDMVQTYSDKEHVPVAIRMDIEGYEGFAFRGMKGLFASSRPCSLFMEIHPGSVSPSFIVDVLQSSRFEIDWISKDGKTIQTNATFKDVQGLTTTADILLHRNGAVVAAGAG
jgi:FkbM family methyltransferase